MVYTLKICRPQPAQGRLLGIPLFQPLIGDVLVPGGAGMGAPRIESLVEAGADGREQLPPR